MYDREGIGPDSWGPHGWKFIHYTALGYPEKPTETDKLKYKKFYTSLCDVIPCILCRNNYVDHLKEFPLTKEVLMNKESLMAWTIKIHNIVNKSNNKKTYSVEEGIKHIKENDDTCIQECKKTKNNDKYKIINIIPIFIFGIILIIQLIRIFYKNKKNISVSETIEQ